MKYEFKGTPGNLKVHKMFNSPLTSVSEDFGEMHHLDAYIIREEDIKILGVAKYCTVHAGFPAVDDISEFEANASLFAAAPDLLQACIAVEHRLSQYCDGKYAEVYGILKSAIHKALNIK